MLKKITKNNRQLIKYKLSIVFLLFTFFKLNSQETKSNNTLINNIKTSLNKVEIEKRIIGHWKFDKLISSNGQEIKLRETIIDSLIIKEKISRPNMTFFKNKRYLIKDKTNKILNKGTWYYDPKEKELVLLFDKPKFNIPVTKLAPELLKQLEKSGSIIKLTKSTIEIHKLINKKLFVIEHLPHDEFELKYNLKVYTRLKK